MSQNEFTKKNHNNGLPGQKILDVFGLNVFGLQLFLESFTKIAGDSTEPLEFTYLGVDIKLQINDKSKQPPDQKTAVDYKLKLMQILNSVYCCSEESISDLSWEVHGIASEERTKILDDFVRYRKELNPSMVF